VSLKLRNLLPLSLAVLPTLSYALPVDWHGAFGVDSTMITQFRRITSGDYTTTGDGSQELGLDTSKKAALSFQSYLFKLSPDIIVNDAATLKAELTTGYANGGMLGDSPSTSSATTSTNPALYYYNQASGSNLNVRKAYLELNADTATYFIGRHTINWGLGAILNDGKNDWDRHASSRDGVTVFFKFNNFYVTPFWSKSSNTGLSRSTNAKEYGSSFLYDNKEKDIAMGLLYVKKTSNNFNGFYTSTVNSTTAITEGDTDIKLTDIYFKKIFGKFNFAVEVPLMTGNLGHVYSSTTVSEYSTKAILLQSNYQASDSWNFGIDAGDVSGSDGSTTKVSATYLNPNYQIANLLFRYNLNAVANYTSQSVYDSYMTNAQYVKLKGSFSTEKWTFDSALIYAKAKEVAKSGSLAFNHTKNKYFTAVANQSDSLGTEFDFNMKYHWNKEVSIGSSLGYLFTGDYFAFTNDTANNNTVKNSMALQVNTLITF
jgi:hypothetical protein